MVLDELAGVAIRVQVSELSDRRGWGYLEAHDRFRDESLVEEVLDKRRSSRGRAQSQNAVDPFGHPYLRCDLE